MSGSRTLEPTGKQLFVVLKRLPADYAPYGDQWRVTGGKRKGAAKDCSCGCRFFITLPGDLGKDWGVCSNPRSHRAGLLTFEHQGCLKFERHEDDEE